MANYCLKLAGEQEKVVSERWLPELRNAVQEARRCFEDCQRVRGLVSEYWLPLISLWLWICLCTGSSCQLVSYLDLLLSCHHKPAIQCELMWPCFCNFQVDEWYEQPAATIVDWVTIDGQSVGAWINLVKQLHMEISRRTLAMSSVGDDWGKQLRPLLPDALEAPWSVWFDSQDIWYLLDSCAMVAYTLLLFWVWLVIS